MLDFWWNGYNLFLINTDVGCMYCARSQEYTSWAVFFLAFILELAPELEAGSFSRTHTSDGRA